MVEPDEVMAITVISLLETVLAHYDDSPDKLEVGFSLYKHSIINALGSISLRG